MRSCPRCGVEVGEQARFCPYDGIALDAGGTLQQTLIGKLVNERYRIAALLGEGGMAWVFLARHEMLGRDIALKVLRPELAQSERAIARFAREARAASRLDHDNVVNVLDFGRATDGFYYLAMEYLVGIALDRELERSGPFPPTRALHVLAQIATGVARAHELNILHRDLKPENIMLCARGGDRDFVKILDFGLSKALEPDERMPALTQEGDVFGTPEYMAPEQWRGALTDARTDVYAIGAIAFQVLTGTTPFLGSPIEQMRGHVMTEPEPPSRRRPESDVPPMFDEVVLKCLAKEPDQRYQSVQEILDALGRSWTMPPSRTRQTTYHTTRAAPPQRSQSEIPDPTVYQSGDVDVIWDGPILCDEIARLHRLRGKRLEELTRALWGEEPPEEVRALDVEIATIERLLEDDGQEVAVLQVRLDEHASATRRIEAELRHDLVTASFRAQAAHHRFPAEFASVLSSLDDEDTTTDTSGTDPPPAEARPAPASGSQPSQDLDPDQRLRRAERRLGSFERRSRREQLEVEARLVDGVARVAAHEAHLAPLYERLSAIVRKAAARRTELRPLLVAFGQIDGALVAYQGLLDMLDLA